ncbi:MAG: putative metal-binding motif-containing protein [Myxococcota bacterium]
MTSTFLLGDADGEGWAACPTGWLEEGLRCDCDDLDSRSHPRAPERCDEAALDNDCDGKGDEQDVIVYLNFYLDQDQDAYGGGASTWACDAPSPAHVLLGEDCQDENPAIHPNQK